MWKYRIKQFFWCFSTDIDIYDKEFIEKYLNKSEYELFYKLPKYEQKHSVKTSKDVQEVLKSENLYNETLVKVALLHDIGKIYCKLNPIDKGILVLMDKLTNGYLKKFNKIKKVYVYYNHPEIGYNLLMKYGYNEEFLYLIRNHHNYNIDNESKYLKILKMCDSRN